MLKLTLNWVRKSTRSFCEKRVFLNRRLPSSILNAWELFWPRRWPWLVFVLYFNRVLSYLIVLRCDRILYTIRGFHFSIFDVVGMNRRFLDHACFLNKRLGGHGFVWGIGYVWGHGSVQVFILFFNWAQLFGLWPYLPIHFHIYHSSKRF